MKNSTFANRLRELIEKEGIKQIDISKKTGIDKANISRYLKGTYEAKQDIVYKISQAYGINESWLMGYANIPMYKYDNAPQNLLTIDDIYPKNNNGFVKIPVLGRVAAGVPIMAQQDILGWEDVPADWVRNSDIFALQIKGDSMEPRMHENDIVICRAQQDVDNNQIAVVMVNGDEATCKRVVKYPDGIMLMSTNPKYPPMQYSNKQIEELPVRILGKVIELRAKF